MEKTTVLLIIAAVGIVFAMWLRANAEYRTRLRWYATRTEPLVIYSKHPNDDTVEERAQLAEWWLAQSGNKWGVPVVCHPYAKFREGHPKYITFDDYMIEVGELMKTARAQFQIKIQGVDRDAYRQFILNQNQ